MRVPRTLRHGWQILSDHLLVVAIVLAVALVTLAALASAAPSAAREQVLVADLRGHALVILDPTRPDEARRIALPGGPHELLQLPDGRVALSLEQSGVIAVVDIASGDVQTFTTGGLPHGLALQRDPEGDRLLVTDRERGTVRRFVIAGTTAQWPELAALPAAGWPHAVVARPEGGVAIARAADAVLSLDGRDLRVSELPETVAISPDGTRVASAGAVGGMVHIVGWDGRDRVDAQVGGRPVRTIFSPDGSLVAAALSASSSVALVDRAGLVRRVAVVGTPDGLAFSADGERLYAADMAGGRVTVIEVASGRVMAVLPAGRSAGSLLVLPAGG